VFTPTSGRAVVLLVDESLQRLVSKALPRMKVKRILIHPSNVEASAASFTDQVEVMRAIELNRLVKLIRDFFKSFESQDFRDPSPTHIHSLVEMSGLSLHALTSDYSKKTKVQKVN
jgi:hypothetical protein